MDSSPSPKVGCCGFPLKKLEYAAKFPVGEVQQTFYQPPQIKTLEKWRASVPVEFEFTLKAWQLITHTHTSPTFRRLKIKLSEHELKECGSFRDTDIVHKALQVTRDCAAALKAKYVLFQCPKSFEPTEINVKQMQKFFSKVDRDGLKFLWEPRGDWKTETIKSLCDELDLLHAVDPFVAPLVNPAFAYLRLHGGKGFRHIYTDEELRHVANLACQAETSYVMFNNMAMLQDAERFKVILKSINS